MDTPETTTSPMRELRSGITPLFVPGELVVHKELDYVLFVGKQSNEDRIASRFRGTTIASLRDDNLAGNENLYDCNDFVACSPKASFILTNEEAYTRANRFPEGFPEVRLIANSDVNPEYSETTQEQTPPLATSPQDDRSTVILHPSEQTFFSYIVDQIMLSGRFSAYPKPHRVVYTSVPLETEDGTRLFNVMNLMWSMTDNAVLSLTFVGQPMDGQTNVSSQFFFNGETYLATSKEASKGPIMEFVKASLDRIFRHQVSKAPEPTD